MLTSPGVAFGWFSTSWSCFSCTTPRAPRRERDSRAKSYPRSSDACMRAKRICRNLEGLLQVFGTVTLIKAATKLNRQLFSLEVKCSRRPLALKQPDCQLPSLR